MPNYIITILVILLSLSIVIWYSFRKMALSKMEPSHQDIIILDDKNFDTAISKGLTLVDFWAEWCTPCKMMVPVLNELSQDLKGQAQVAKLDIEKYPSISSIYHIRSIPTCILYKDGKEVHRFNGYKPKGVLLKEITNQLKN